ncbi:MAG: hypothetical protein IJ793_01355 [Opitutales bacterium]|nr:hypothetical protein [Opitutales bacterium]
MVQNVIDHKIPTDLDPVSGSQPHSPKVTENKTAQFETSVKKLQENFLNDAKLLKASRTVRSFGDIFTANMAGKGFGRIAQFFTNIGLYRQEPEKLLRNVEKNIDALGELIHTQANSNGKITSTVIGNISGCIETFLNTVENIAGDQSLPGFIRDGFRELYKKDIFKVQQYGFLRTIGKGMEIAEKLTDLKTEADFNAIKELADKIDTCDFIRKEHPGACRKSLFTLLSNQFSHVTNNFLNNAKEFITSFNNDIDAALKENEELNGEKTLSDEKCKELNKKFLEFTGEIRPFYDAMTGSEIDNKEPECLQKFRNDCRKTLAKFKKLPQSVKEHGCIYGGYKDLDSFPYFVKIDEENKRKKQAETQKA